MHKGYSISQLDRLEAYAERLEFIERNNPTILSETIVCFCFQLLYAIQKTSQLKEKKEKKACFKKILQYRNIWHNYKSIGKPEGIKYSIWYCMAYISLDFTAFVRNLFGIGF